MVVTDATPPKPLYIPVNDSNSMFPHPGKSTIPTWLVVVMVIVIGLIFICGLFTISIFFPNIVKKFKIFPAIWNFGLVLTISTTIVNILKNFVGRARPDMLALCGDSVNADPSSCPNITKSVFDENYRSWPSGHSSSSMAGFMFAAAVIQETFIWSRTVALFFASLFFLLAFYVGATRIRDFRHHPDDVVAGFLIGYIVFSAVWSQCKKYTFRELDEEKVSASNEDSAANGDTKNMP